MPSLPTGIIRDVRELGPLGLDTSFDEGDFRLRDVKNTSYVSRRRMDDADFNPDEVDVDGLPLVYNEARVSQYWGQRPGELAKRWANFVGISAPWLTSLANAFIQGRIGDEATQRALARDAVVNLEKLGPTFIKLGQVGGGRGRRSAPGRCSWAHEWDCSLGAWSLPPLMRCNKCHDWCSAAHF